MIKVGIIGANGFLGLELLRILSIHPKVSIQKILKRENDIDDEFAHLSSLNLSELQTSNLGDFYDLDVGLALHHLHCLSPGIKGASSDNANCDCCLACLAKIIKSE